MSSDVRVAFLRGINVGGRNIVPMADLRSTLASAGLGDVRTYIQSGNVVFRSADTDPATTIATAVRDRFGVESPVVVRSLDDLDRIAGTHPDLHGDVPSKWLLVFLLDRAPSADDAPDPARFGSDRFVVDGREVYATYPGGSGRSKLTLDVIERSFGVIATARNVSTLRAVVDLVRRP
jgi:uncharacterized protein (DUF1697 family)